MQKRVNQRHIPADPMFKLVDYLLERISVIAEHKNLGFIRQ
jgi:hypothetical protein